MMKEERDQGNIRKGVVLRRLEFGQKVIFVVTDLRAMLSDLKLSVLREKVTKFSTH